MERVKRKLVLENGDVYVGYGFGAQSDAIGEIVFNTSMVGYQEIISDPSYTGQMVVMTYPLIGNYGISDDDYETKNPSIGGLVVREYNDLPSNFRYTKTLSEVMEECKVPGISGIDTRKLTRSIREKGSRRALITGLETSFSLTYAQFGLQKTLDLMSNNPAKILGIKVIGKNKFDLDKTYTVHGVDFASKCKITPYENMTLKGVKIDD